MQFRNKHSTLLLLLGSLLWVTSGAHAQGPGGPPGHGPGFGPGMGPGAPPLERSMRGGFGRWWDDPKMGQQIGITTDQKQKMDDIFQQNKLKLIDLVANLQKQETIMEPLIESDQPDEGKILSQIDAVAQARAELEKAHARMLLGIRRVLTQDQWKKLQAFRPEGPRGPGGARDFHERRGGNKQEPPQLPPGEGSLSQPGLQGDGGAPGR